VNELERLQAQAAGALDTRRRRDAEIILRLTKQRPEAPLEKFLLDKPDFECIKPFLMTIKRRGATRLNYEIYKVKASYPDNKLSDVRVGLGWPIGWAIDSIHGDPSHDSPLFLCADHQLRAKLPSAEDLKGKYLYTGYAPLAPGSEIAIGREDWEDDDHIIRTGSLADILFRIMSRSGVRL
jgi:hypothetical protein